MIDVSECFKVEVESVTTLSIFQYNLKRSKQGKMGLEIKACNPYWQDGRVYIYIDVTRGVWKNIFGISWLPWLKIESCGYVKVSARYDEDKNIFHSMDIEAHAGKEPRDPFFGDGRKQVYDIKGFNTAFFESALSAIQTELDRQEFIAARTERPTMQLAADPVKIREEEENDVK